MMTVTQAEDLLAARLSPSRVAHCRRVASLATGLAARHGGDTGAALIAGLLHDLCREVPGELLLQRAREAGLTVSRAAGENPVALLHAPVAAAELERQGEPREITRAVALHTVGAAGMSTLEKCLYVADFSEPGRAGHGVSEVRALADASLEDAAAEAARLTIVHLLRRARGVEPAAVELYNEGHGRLERL